MFLVGHIQVNSLVTRNCFLVTTYMCVVDYKRRYNK